MNLTTMGTSIFVLFAISCMGGVEGKHRGSRRDKVSDQEQRIVRKLGKSKKDKANGKSATDTPPPVAGFLENRVDSNDSSFLSDICDIFLDFDDIGDENCNDISHPQQYLLCPSAYGTRKICEGNTPGLDESVFVEYCQPLFSPLDDEEHKEACVQSCMDYVSPKNLDCCGVSCVDGFSGRKF